MEKFNTMNLKVDDTFNKELPSDPIKNKESRQVLNSCFSFVDPMVPSNPKLVHVSSALASELGFTFEDIESRDFLEIFTGARVLENTAPYSMCYGGHQFGNWAGQLGDGRAINLMEIERDHKRYSLQLKGSGKTPYSRNSDGLAVLRSSVREHLCSEAMHHLGVPTTRSLSLSLSGDQVMRDMLYDGNSELEPGAIVCRVAPTFLRFGSFQIFASRGDHENLKKLTDYTIKHFFSEIKLKSTQRYIDFFNAVLDKTLAMIIEWQRVGFVHGVMNTDNMSILGLTIDFGPYGWLEDYDKNWTPNTTDKQNRRYRFGQQSSMAHWNLFQLANTLYPLIEDAKPLEDALSRYGHEFKKSYHDMMKKKIGLIKDVQGDDALISTLESNLELIETDMTIFFRNLSNVSINDKPEECLNKLMDAFYNNDEVRGDVKDKWISWSTRYLTRTNLEETTDDGRKNSMNLTNPKFVLRNYMAQLAIDSAEEGNYQLINELYKLLQNPYDEQPKFHKWFAKRPDWAKYKVGCSMLSCSS
ncbi:MAG: hypothetical protein ACI8XB_002310 [Patiriisocius sp.]|jgi:uncharacterized protein YdiU (UPF0061 family)